MVNLPESVIAIVREATSKNPSDVDAATTAAEAKIRELPEFDDLVCQFIRTAIKELIYDERHRTTKAVKYLAGLYGKPAKTPSKDSERVQKAYSSVWSFYIGGTVLGAVLGRELHVLARKEEKIAKGHTLNQRICLNLATLVPLDKRVGQVISDKKLNEIIELETARLRAEASSAAAGH
jgi:hypothetical protein